MQNPPTHLVVMGVAGSGKSTLAAALSRLLGWACAEADEFHPQANITKMSQGIPLQDADRWPWLREIRTWMTAQAQAGCSTVLTCSALRKSYRELLTEAEGRVIFLNLDGGADVIRQRMQGREGHFMPSALLPSQLATLEALSQEELDAGSLRLDISQSPGQLVAAVVQASNFPRRGPRRVPTQVGSSTCPFERPNRHLLLPTCPVRRGKGSCGGLAWRRTALPFSYGHGQAKAL